MRSIPAAGKTITLKLRYDNFETISRSLSLSHYTNDASEISLVTQELLKVTEFGERPVRLLGIGLSNLDINEKTKRSNSSSPLTNKAKKSVILLA